MVLLRKRRTKFSSPLVVAISWSKLKRLCKIEILFQIYFKVNSQALEPPKHGEIAMLWTTNCKCVMNYYYQCFTKTVIIVIAIMITMIRANGTMDL